MILDRQYLNDSNKISLKRLVLTNKEIQEIEKETFNGLTSLNSILLNDNYLSEIDQETFKGLYQLKELNLNNNQIRFIDKDLFKGLENLIVLNLNNNQIKFIAECLFSDLKNLWYIDLNYNKIERIYKEYFNGLTNLKYIHLSNNQIQSLEKETFNGLNSLEAIYLSSNQLKRLDGLFNGLTNLKLLDCSNNQIEKLSNCVFQDVSNLKEIYLDGNLLESIQSEHFNCVYKLEILSLKNNKIQYIDANSFDYNQKLIGINLKNNQLCRIDMKTFTNAGLNKLEWLILSNNNLQTIDEKFANLESLKKIDLSNNQLENLDPQTFRDVKSLRKLNLNNNQLIELNKCLFQNLVYLNKLDLSCNLIEELDHEIFKDLVNLTSINLSNNNLEVLDEFTFMDLFHLNKIDLSNNNLKRLEKETFKYLNKLIHVNLSGNQLRDLEKELFNSNDLQVLNLNDNQLSSIPANTLLKDNKSLLEINMSNNSISQIQVNIISSLKQNTTIDLRNNIEIYDLPFVFDCLFLIIKKDKLTKEMQNFYKQPVMTNKEYFFIVEKPNLDDFLLAFYLNKSVFKRKDLFDKTNPESFEFKLTQIKTCNFTVLDYVISYKMIDESFIIYFKNYIESILKQNKLIQNLEFKLKSARSLEIICERNDLLLFEAFFGDLEIISDQNNETTECDENKFIFNHKEFYFNINFVQCFKIILHNKNEKMAIYLFRLLSYVIKKYDVPQFAIRSFGKYSYFKLEEYKQITNFNEKFLKEFLIKIFKLKWFDLIHVILDLAYDKLNNQLETKFIYLNDDYYFQNDTNIAKSKELDSKNIYSNKSDDQIQVVVQQQQIDLLSPRISYTQIIMNAKNNKKSDLDEIIERNNNLTCLRSISSEFNSDSSMDSDDDESESAISNEQKSEQIIANNSNKYKNKPPNNLEDNILYLLNNSENSAFLIHETTQELLHLKWRYIPRFTYYLNLSLYLLFLIFYTIHALNTVTFDLNVDLLFQSKIICSILLAYFICMELLQVWDLQVYLYFYSIVNLLQLANFIICFVVLYLPEANLKSSLCSITSIITYSMFVSRLDKFYGIGPFIKVFGKLISRSIGLITIIIIMLIGFALAITVRADYYKTMLVTNQTTSRVNEISNFEFDFINNIYTMFTYMAGQVVSVGMGIDTLDESSLVMFIVYGMFCFTMTILFYNISIGIATYEIRKIVDNSRIEIASCKIDYIFKLELKLKRFKLYKLVEKIFKWFEKFYTNKIYKINFLSRAYNNEYIKIIKNKKDEIDQRNEKSAMKISLMQMERTDRLLIELRQISNQVQNQFSFLDKKMDRMEKRIELCNKRKEIISYQNRNITRF